MADPQKPNWWTSLPGILTAATGFVAALSGLIAGLSQLGVFERRSPAPQEVAASNSPRDLAAPEEHPAAVPSDSGRAESTSAARRVVPAVTPGPPRAPAGAPGGTRPTPGPPVPVAAPATDDSGASTPSDTTPSDTTPSPAVVLPVGAGIELVTATKICAPDSGYRRFRAKVAAPARVGGAVVLARNTPAVLRLGRLDGGLVAQLDSLVVSDTTIPVRANRTRVRRSLVVGTCLKPAARIAVSLGAAVTLPRADR